MTKTPETPVSSDGGGAVDFTDLPNLSPEEAGLLAKHFEVFTETTNKLVAAHQHLQGQTERLMEELERKNRQLESVNHELAAKIEEEERVRSFLDCLIDSMRTGLVAFDSEGGVTRMNRAASETLGWTEAMPVRFSELLEDTRESPLSRIFEGDSGPLSGEIRLRKRGGETSPLVRYNAAPLTGPEDASRGGLFVFEDLSRLRLLEERVRRAGRLAALGELAAGVAHELRNPLATMRGFLQLLPTEYEDPEFRKECSTRLIDEIDRLARLTDELLDFSRPAGQDLEPVRLDEVVEEVLEEQQLCEESESARGLKVVRRPGEETPLLSMQRERIKQVVLNLVINARQAMPEGGDLTWGVETRKERWGEENEEREVVCLSVSDTGHGIESRHLDSLFDPFFTTKSEGTGLGLAICNRIVEEHGGMIRVTSARGKGSRFTLYFPTAESSE